jgi:hypothetical protein
LFDHRPNLNDNANWETTTIKAASETLGRDCEFRWIFSVIQVIQRLTFSAAVFIHFSKSEIHLLALLVSFTQPNNNISPSEAPHTGFIQRVPAIFSSMLI